MPDGHNTAVFHKVVLANVAIATATIVSNCSTYDSGSRHRNRLYRIHMNSQTPTGMVHIPTPCLKLGIHISQLINGRFPSCKDT